MKKCILLFILGISMSGAHAQMQLNLPLLYNWSDPTIPPAFYGAYNDCWGYADSLGHEYAIIGSAIGTHFFDVTNPTNPVQVSFQPSKDQSTLTIHRDFKTYSHYCYGVADEGANSLQIFDLQYLPDSVVKVYDNDVLCTRAHNIFIEGNKLYMPSTTVGGNFHAMDVFSLANPVNPTYISTLSSTNFSHVHDVFVRNDTAYCSVGYDGLYVYSYVNPVSPQLLLVLDNYPEMGYSHSSWLTPTGFTLIVADETHGSGLKAFDISDFSNPIVKSVFRSNLLNVPVPNGPNGSIPHNEFIREHYLFVSYYHDGVQVFDIADPSNPVQVAYYDTYPSNVDYSSYAGCWGVYPFLPSGTIVASDISNGLFLLNGSTVLSAPLPEGVNQGVAVIGNPVMGDATLQVTLKDPGKVTLKIVDMLGRPVYNQIVELQSGTNSLTIPSQQWSDGIYLARVSGNGLGQTVKLVRSGSRN